MNASKTKTLAVLAAGMGSRYGGLKQLDGVGPSGETVMDYALFDAIQSGFRKFVFVVRDEFKDAFQVDVDRRLGADVETHFVCQSLADIPDGYELESGRTKPWGTGHAIWSCRHVIEEPFGVINADDFYGRKSYEQLAHSLEQIAAADGSQSALIAFRLRNTLSDHGTVSRGICDLNQEQQLQQITECTAIEKDGSGARFGVPEKLHSLSGDEPVSMNMWAFDPAIFSLLETGFKRFLDTQAGDRKAEFYIPSLVNDSIKQGQLTTKVLWSNDNWLGMTYPEDREMVTEGIRKLVADGQYPESLWPA